MLSRRVVVGCTVVTDALEFGLPTKGICFVIACRTSCRIISAQKESTYTSGTVHYLAERFKLTIPSSSEVLAEASVDMTPDTRLEKRSCIFQTNHDGSLRSEPSKHELHRRKHAKYDHLGILRELC